MEGGLNKDPVDGKHGKGQGNKNYCEAFYTLDKVLLKVDLQSIR